MLINKPTIKLNRRTGAEIIKVKKIASLPKFKT